MYLSDEDKIRLLQGMISTHLKLIAHDESEFQKGVQFAFNLVNEHISKIEEITSTPRK